MTTIRTISGIPDDTWEEAQKEYTNTSKKIKELLEKDLRLKTNEKSQQIDLLKNSDLTSDQIEAVREVMTTGKVNKNETQLGKILAKHFSEDSSRKNCKKAIVNSEKVPYESDGRGIKGKEVCCPKCGSSTFLKGLRKNNFDCFKCGARLYDL